MKLSSIGESLMVVGIWFQVWGAAEQKVRCPKSVFALETYWLQECGNDWVDGRI